MLTPSYSELMEKINEEQLVDSKITSRYTIVLAVAKRARQIIDGSEPLTPVTTDRAVSIAVDEMGQGKIKINMEADVLDESYERMLAFQTKFKNTASDHNLREDMKDNYEAPIYTKDDEDDIDEDNFKDGFIEEDEDGEYLYEDEEDLEEEQDGGFEDDFGEDEE